MGAAKALTRLTVHCILHCQVESHNLSTLSYTFVDKLRRTGQGRSERQIADWRPVIMKVEPGRAGISHGAGTDVSVLEIKRIFPSLPLQRGRLGSLVASSFTHSVATLTPQTMSTSRLLPEVQDALFQRPQCRTHHSPSADQFECLVFFTHHSERWSTSVQMLSGLD